MTSSLSAVRMPKLMLLPLLLTAAALSEGHRIVQMQPEVVMMTETKPDVDLIIVPRKMMDSMPFKSPELHQDNAEEALRDMVGVADMGKAAQLEHERLHFQFLENDEGPNVTIPLSTVPPEVITTTTAATTTSPSTTTRLPPTTTKPFAVLVRDVLQVIGLDSVVPFDCGQIPASASAQQLMRITQVQLGSLEKGVFYHRCPGVLITATHILTDAECAASPNVNIVRFNDPLVERYVVSRKISPGVRTKMDLLKGYNIGLIEFNSPVQFSEKIRAACLPNLFETPDLQLSTRLYVVSYKIEDGLFLRTAEIRVQNLRSYGSAVCFTSITTSSPNNSLYKLLTKRHLCVNQSFRELGRSIVMRYNPETLRIEIVAVGAFANAQFDSPVAYSLVQPHRYWIERTLRN